MLAVCVSVSLSYVHLYVFLFPDNKLSKCQWIFTKLCVHVCIDIVEIWFGIVNGHISSIFDSYLPATGPYFHFRMITFVNINGFSPNLVCALILCTSALGLLMDKFCPFLRVLYLLSVFYFQDNNLNESQWIFTKFDMCIDIVDIYFGSAHWQISSTFIRVICPG